MDFTEEYRKYLTTFSLVTRDAFELSIYLLEFFTLTPENFSNENLIFLSIFSKLALHANSILTILPKDDPKTLYGTENFKVIDLSSIASLTRDIIDADNTLFYLFTERIEASDREFRLLLFGLHGYMRQKELINFVGGSHQEQMNANISKQIEIFINQIEKNSFYQNLQEEMLNNSSSGKRAKDVFKRGKEGKIENVKDALFLTRKQIITRRGIDLSLFDAMYIYLSSHVHSFHMGTSLVGSSIALDDQSLLLLLKTIKDALFYLSLAILDTTILFPNTEEELSPESRKIIQSIKKGEPYVL